MVDTEMGIAADEAKEPTVGQVQQEEDEESNILDEYFMGIEEEEHGGPETGARSLRTAISLFNPDSTLPLSKPTTSIWIWVILPRHRNRYRLFKSRPWPSEFRLPLLPHLRLDHMLSSLRRIW